MMHNKTSLIRIVAGKSLFRTQYGFSLVELLSSLAIAALVIAALGGVISQTLNTETAIRERNELTQQARFAMQRMVAAVQGTTRLLLPLADNPNTDWREHVREETVPASAPEGSSTKATAVLAVTLDPSIDRDRDGWADANNDKDFLDINNNSARDADEPERIDEDIGIDNNNDNAPGIGQLDDNGNGQVDENGNVDDNDEDGMQTEDSLDGIDNDADGSVDEDSSNDSNGDGAPGVVGIDDDMDGSVDEGQKGDDDEDSIRDEDWFDPVVYYLSGNQLIERLPALDDVNGDSVVTGADFTESIIAENVTLFRIERIPQGGGRATLVDITLTLTGDSGKTVNLTTQVRVGGGS